MEVQLCLRWGNKVRCCACGGPHYAYQCTQKEVKVPKARTHCQVSMKTTPFGGVARVEKPKAIGVVVVVSGAKAFESDDLV